MTKLKVWILLCIAMASSSLSAEVQTHPAMRELPTPSDRPFTEDGAYFADAKKGDDKNDGSKDSPWRTVRHAVKQVQPGNTLCLRGGTYYESVIVDQSIRDITIRSFPGELAVIDGGWREFCEDPANAWEPFDGGVADEFRSRKSYDRGGGFGQFGDSMVPFQRYLTFYDLRSKNELWHRELSNRSNDPTGIYAGPGVRRDAKTGRIHIRLAHTKLAGLGANHYRGETDPRKIPLVIAGHDYGVRLVGAKQIRLQDIVVRGASRSAVNIEDSDDVELDGVTLYGSSSALRTHDSSRVRLFNSALRGHSAPWHSRGHHKDRSGAGYLVVAHGRDFEFSHCEFTDNHDGILLKDVENIHFHHNVVDNMNDDGVEMGPKRKTGRMLIYQNLITRCLLSFSLHGNPGSPNVDHEAGSGTYIFRNVVDLRQGTYKSAPPEPDPSGEYLRRIGTLVGDHGGPIWPVMYVYHNTFILPSDTWRDYYGFGLGGHLANTTRRVFNNIFVQIDGLPGFNFSSLDVDLHADSNLLWGVNEGPTFQGDFFAKWRSSEKFQTSKKVYSPGFAARDIFADPKLAGLKTHPSVELKPGSPAINAGMKLPAEWPDVVREKDGKPDIGAAAFKQPQPTIGRH